MALGHQRLHQLGSRREALGLYRRRAAHPRIVGDVTDMSTGGQPGVWTPLGAVEAVQHCGVTGEHAHYELNGAALRGSDQSKPYCRQ